MATNFWKRWLTSLTPLLTDSHAKLDLCTAHHIVSNWQSTSSVPAKSSRNLFTLVHRPLFSPVLQLVPSVTKEDAFRKTFSNASFPIVLVQAQPVTGLQLLSAGIRLHQGKINFLRIHLQLSLPWQISYQFGFYRHYRHILAIRLKYLWVFHKMNLCRSLQYNLANPGMR